MSSVRNVTETQQATGEAWIRMAQHARAIYIALELALAACTLFAHDISEIPDKDTGHRGWN